MFFILVETLYCMGGRGRAEGGGRDAVTPHSVLRVEIQREAVTRCPPF